MYEANLTEHDNQIILCNQMFHADYQMREFIDNTDPTNKISFEQFKLTGTGLAALWYDPDTNNVGNSINSRYIRLPVEVLERPFSNDNDRMRRLNEQPYAKWFYLVGIDFRERIAGKLPTIDLVGEEWTVDGFLNQLRNNKEPWIILNGKDLDEFEGDDRYCRIVYDRKNKQDISGSLGNLTELSKDITLLKVKMPFLMDPVGYSRHDQQLLMSVALNGTKQHYKADVLDGEMEKLKVIVNKNRLRAGLPALAAPEKRKKDNKNIKKGKRL